MRKEILEAILKADNKIETLRLMPSEIKGGVVYNFNGDAMFNVLNKDTLIMDEGNIKSRYTDALQGRYLLCLNNTKFEYVGGEATTTNTESDEPSLEDQLLAKVAAGDKKAVRSICKELKEKWFALDSDDVEDAIDDIKDCVSDKDVDGVKEILADLDGDDTPVEPPAEETTKVDEVVKEILEDLETAINENDETDIKELLAELADEVGEDSSTYKKWFTKTVTDTPPAEETTEVDEILEDLETAISENDMDEAKEILAELADEVGEDSDLYKEWVAKVTPKKKNRRERRGK